MSVDDAGDVDSCGEGSVALSTLSTFGGVVGDGESVVGKVGAGAAGGSALALLPDLVELEDPEK